MKCVYIIGETGTPKTIRLEKKLRFYKIAYTVIEITTKQDIVKNIGKYPLMVIKDGEEEIKRWEKIVPTIDEIREYL